jgi:hypothetical protein
VKIEEPKPRVATRSSARRAAQKPSSSASSSAISFQIPLATSSSSSSSSATSTFQSLAPLPPPPPALPVQPPMVASSGSSKTKNIFQQKERYTTINGSEYIELSSIGKGGSSTVSKVISTSDGTIYALKKVDLSKYMHSDEEEIDQTFASYSNEIDLLWKLKNSSPHIINLIDYEIMKKSMKIYMLLEFADIDLAKLLTNMKKANTTGEQSPSGESSLDPFFIRMIWKEMLLSVHHIHENRIVHGKVFFLVVVDVVFILFL